MIPYFYGSLWTRRTLYEHCADVRGQLWTSWIEPWVRIPPPPFFLSIGFSPKFENSLGSFDNKTDSVGEFGYHAWNTAYSSSK